MATLFLRLVSWKILPQSIKIFVKLDVFANTLVVWFVFVYTESYWEQQNFKEVTFWFWQWQKCEFQIDWGGLFHDINLKNNDAIVIPWFSIMYMWISSDKFWWHRWKIKLPQLGSEPSWLGSSWKITARTHHYVFSTKQYIGTSWKHLIV